MPMKWTPDNDQLLLLKILETHELTVDSKKVAGAWPGTDAKDKPTPRAITERLVKMRQMAKTTGGSTGSFAIKNSADAGGSSSNPVTPTKPRGVANPVSGKASSGKRKLTKTEKAEKNNGIAKDEEDHEDEDMDGMETPTKPPKVKREEVKGIKLELAELDSIADVPSKRSRKSSRLPTGMVDYVNDDDETEQESSASEYVPEESLRDGAVKEDLSFA